MAERQTARSVVAYAEKLRRAAQAQMVADPYARPYWPTTAAARKLVQRMANEAVRSLGALATDDQREEARARGPELAIAELARRAARADAEYREDELTAQRSRQRLARRQREAERDRSARRAGLTYGQRLDQALAGLSAIPAPPGTGFDARVSGGESENPIAPFPGDPAARARAKAREAVRFAEEELDDARRRRVEREKVA